MFEARFCSLNRDSGIIKIILHTQKNLGIKLYVLWGIGHMYSLKLMKQKNSYKFNSESSRSRCNFGSTYAGHKILSPNSSVCSCVTHSPSVIYFLSFFPTYSKVSYGTTRLFVTLTNASTTFHDFF